MILDNVDTSKDVLPYEHANVCLNLKIGKIAFRKWYKHVVGIFDERVKYESVVDLSFQMIVDTSDKGTYDLPYQHNGYTSNVFHGSIHRKIFFHIYYMDSYRKVHLPLK